MVGHGSPPPEDRGDFPQRKVGSQEQHQTVKPRPTSRRAMFTPQWQQGTQPMPERAPWKQRLKALGRE